MDIIENPECYTWNIENGVSGMEIMVNDKAGSPSTILSYQYFVFGEVI